jgi:hypothetical protein
LAGPGVAIGKGGFDRRGGLGHQHPARELLPGRGYLGRAGNPVCLL